MRPSVLCLLVLCLLQYAPYVLAQDAAEWRGAWLSTKSSAGRVLYLVAHPDVIGGTWCNDCANPDSLAFVDDGRSTESGLHFSLYFARAERSFSVVPARARLADGALYLELDVAQGEAESYRLVRGPAWSAPQNAVAPASPATASISIWCMKTMASASSSTDPSAT